MKSITTSSPSSPSSPSWLRPCARAAAPLPAGEIDFAALDGFVAGQMAKHGLKGVALAVTRGDETIYLKGYGTAGGGRPMTPQTPMYIGSQSKSFTGLAVAQLIEQGKIDANATVISYLPWFRVADPQATQKIRLSHLLHHTSGLSEAGFTTVLPENASIETAVRALADAKLTAPVGTKFQYFNLGYDVLAAIVETVSGQPYAAYLQEHILNPLGMAATTTDPGAAHRNGLSQGYSRFFGFTIPQPQPHRIYEVGAGYIISTAEDLARYAIAMNNDAAGVLTKGSSRLFAPVMGYGMGWFIGGDHIFHGGANETFKTYLDLYPSRRLGIVLLINQGYMLDHYISADQVFAGVEAILLGRDPAPLSQGWSVRTIGWGLLGLVLALCALHTHNFLRLRGWQQRARLWSKARLALDIAVSFLIPLLIGTVVFSQIQAFLGYRFNWTYQMRMMFTTLPDIGILMVVGLVPDLVQGFIKLALLRRPAAPTLAPAAAPLLQ